MPVVVAAALSVSGCGAETWSFEGDAGSDAASAPEAQADTGPYPTFGCMTQQDCPVGFCNQRSGLCVACVKDSQCPMGVCDPDLNECVACGTSQDCGPGQTCMGHQCIPTCGDGGTCPPNAPYCDPRGLCVECVYDGDCAGIAGGQWCNQQSGMCVECVLDEQCVAPTARFCNTATDQCVGCLTSVDCRDGEICNTVTFTCGSKVYWDQ
jgi:hypothetical protein